MQQQQNEDLVEIRTSQLDPKANYTLYQLFIGGVCVRRQITPFHQYEISDALHARFVDATRLPFRRRRGSRQRFALEVV